MSRWFDGCFLLCHMLRGELLPVASDTARQSKEYLSIKDAHLDAM